jgi:hypothetical protein
VPAHHAPNNEGVAQVMKPRRIVRTTIYPTELVTQLIEDAVCLPVAERLA